MAFDTALLDLMPWTLKVNTLKGVSTDGYGTATWSSSTRSHRCRVVEKQTLVHTFDGDEQVARTVAWVRSTSTFGPWDKITLPDGTHPRLLAVEEYPDEQGHHHSRLYFGG
jgi:hypothetical protein